MKNKIIAFSTALALGLVTAGCGGGGSSATNASSSSSSEATYKISGSVQSQDLAVNSLFNRLFAFFLPNAYAALPNFPNGVLIIYDKGTGYKEFTIGSDGKFEIDLSQVPGKDFTAFLVNTTSKKVFCNISLDAINGDRLNLIKTDTMKTDLALGTLDYRSACQSSTSIEGSNAFKAESLENLKKLARNDDALALYANAYANENIESYIAVGFSMGDLTSITNVFNELPQNLSTTKFGGASPLFYVGEYFGKALSTVDLFPPSSIKYSNGTRSTSYIYDADNTKPMRKTGLAFNNSSNLTTVETFAVDSFPAGDWILKNGVDSNFMGSFIFNGATPFDDSGYFKAFAPKIKISTTNGNISSIAVQLYRQLANGQYEQVDRTTFDTLANDIVFSYVLNGQNISQNFSETQSPAEYELAFTAPQGVLSSNLSRVIFSYKIGQAKYQFFFEQLPL